MDFETFKDSCKNVLESESWTWSDKDDILIFSKLFQVKDRSISDDLLFDEELEEPTDIALYAKNDKRTLKLEVHIIYSIIWDAPECYLNASWQDSGEIVSIDRFCSMINKPIPKLLTKRVRLLV